MNATSGKLACALPSIDSRSTRDSLPCQETWVGNGVVCVVVDP